MLCVVCCLSIVVGSLLVACRSITSHRLLGVTRCSLLFDLFFVVLRCALCVVRCVLFVEKCLLFDVCRIALLVVGCVLLLVMCSYLLMVGCGSL